MIFVHSIFDNFCDNHFFLLLYKNNKERKKKIENKNKFEYEKEGCFKIEVVKKMII